MMTHIYSSADLTSKHGLSSHYTLQDAVYRPFQYRYAALPKDDTVEYIFTRDPALLHQYYILREQMFIRMWGLKGFSGDKDAYDDRSEILVAHIGKQCVGGARLTVSSPDDEKSLPLERPDFQLRKLFPELELENKIYAECSRMAVIPDLKVKEISTHISKKLIQQCIARKVDYGFWVAPILQARNTRQVCANSGLGCKIRTDIEIPDRDDYEGIKMYLVVLDFTAIYKEKNARQKKGDLQLSGVL